MGMHDTTECVNCGAPLAPSGARGPYCGTACAEADADD